MTLYAPELSIAHMVDVPKGWFDMTALDYVAKISANVTFTVPTGRIVHLNSVGEFETGVGQTDMGLILIQGQASYDVNNPGTTPSGRFMHKPIFPAGNNSALVCKGGYEIQDSEFDTDQTYVPGDLLTAAVANADSTTGGVLTNAGSGINGDVQQFVDPVCGVVAKGRFTNSLGTEVLDFWPEWLPGAYA